MCVCAMRVWWCVVLVLVLVLGAWCLVLGAWCLVLGAWCLVLGAWCLVLGAWCLVCVCVSGSGRMGVCAHRVRRTSVYVRVSLARAKRSLCLPGASSTGREVLPTQICAWSNSSECRPAGSARRAEANHCIEQNHWSFFNQLSVDFGQSGGLTHERTPPKQKQIHQRTKSIGTIPVQHGPAEWEGSSPTATPLFVVGRGNEHFLDHGAKQVGPSRCFFFHTRTDLRNNGNQGSGRISWCPFFLSILVGEPNLPTKQETGKRSGTTRCAGAPGERVFFLPLDPAGSAPRLWLLGIGWRFSPDALHVLRALGQHPSEELLEGDLGLSVPLKLHRRKKKTWPLKFKGQKTTKSEKKKKKELRN